MKLIYELLDREFKIITMNKCSMSSEDQCINKVKTSTKIEKIFKESNRNIGHKVKNIITELKKNQ